MSYPASDDWRVWKARLVADTTLLTELLRTEMPPLPVAADVLEAMGLLVDEWARAVVEMDMAYGGRLDTTTTEQLRVLFRQLSAVRANLRALPEAIDLHRGARHR